MRSTYILIKRQENKFVDSCNLSNETNTGKHDLVRSPFQDKYKGHSLSDKDGHISHKISSLTTSYLFTTHPTVAT